MKIRFLATALAVAAVLGVTAAANAAAASSTSPTARRTRAFFAALSARDFAALAAMLHPDVTWSVPMAASGDNDAGGATYVGRDQVMANFRSIESLLRTVRSPICGSA